MDEFFYAVLAPSSLKNLVSWTEGFALSSFSCGKVDRGVISKFTCIVLYIIICISLLIHPLQSVLWEVHHHAQWSLCCFQLFVVHFLYL